jgi:hypothetical protein
MAKTVSFRLGKHSRTLSDIQVLAVAREAIATGLPADAKRYKHWAVVVDDELIGLKWLFSRVTNIPSEDFQSQYAKDVLERRLGIEVVNSKNPRRATNRTPQIGKHRASSDERERLAELASNLVREIRDFLSGRKEHRPTDQQLCEWVQFCYTFELYVEGRDLFALVNPTDVHPWLLERTRKLASICELKVNPHG